MSEHDDKSSRYYVDSGVAVTLRPKNFFCMWRCLECDATGVGGMEALQEHLKQHTAEREYNEAVNYFGE